jgi:hypothetical protein
MTIFKLPLFDQPAVAFAYILLTFHVRFCIARADRLKPVI